MTKLPGPVELEISELAGIFAETRNPAAAWRAFALARRHDLPVPLAVGAEVVRFAEAVVAPLESDRGSITAASIAEAWGLSRGKKPAPGLRNIRRDFDVWLEFWELRRGGMARGDAIGRLVVKHNRSPQLIEGILTRFAKRYGDGDPFENPDFRKA